MKWLIFVQNQKEVVRHATIIDMMKTMVEKHASRRKMKRRQIFKLEVRTMEFQNNITGEVLSHADFVTLVWDEAERQFNENHKENWCNLTRDEQISFYCDQYEHQLEERDWRQI